MMDKKKMRVTLKILVVLIIFASFILSSGCVFYGECETDADCSGAPGNSCIDNFCVRPCDSNSDCSDALPYDAPSRCNDVNQELSICTPYCEADTDCQDEGIVCRNNVCTPKCASDADCPFGTICAADTCTVFCADNSVCPAGTSCEGNACLSKCDAGEEETGCPDGTSCVDGTCLEVCGEGDECSFGTCEDGTCNVWKTLFRISNQQVEIGGSYETLPQGHAQVSGTPIFSNTVQTPSGEGFDGTGLKGGRSACYGNSDMILTLSNKDNAHVAQYGYPEVVCLHSDIDDPRVKCRYVEGESCPEGFSCIARVNKYTNSHIQVCDDDSPSPIFTGDLADYVYPIRVCCEVPTDGDGDGYASIPEGTDCDDDNTAINPGATENPTDGIDNNCNDLIDENRDDDGDGYYNNYDDCNEPPASLPSIDPSYFYEVDDNGCTLSVGNGNLLHWSGSADAYVVRDPTAPVTADDSYNSLRVSGSGNIEYAAELKGGTEYTISFWYKVESGSMRFQAESDLVAPVDFNDLTWKEYSATFTTPGSPEDVVEAKLRWSLVGAGSAFYIDSLQLEESPEATRFNTFLTAEVGCCPFDFCWTGGLVPGHPSCIHDDFYEKNVSMPPIGWDLADFGAHAGEPSTFLDAEPGYRCINGSWKFSRPKMTPLFDGAGFCPDDTQCFIGGSDLAEEACVQNGTFHRYRGETADDFDWFYCYEGNWTTRTKEIALQMLDMAQAVPGSDYTIFCDRYDKALNSDDLFSYYRDYVGDNIVNILASDLVNEFCVMDLDGQVVAGVSLNGLEINETFDEESCIPGGIQCWTAGKCDSDGCLINPPDFVYEPKSFIEMLKGPTNSDYCDGALDPGDYDGLYHECNGRDVYYNAHLQSVIFAKPTSLRQDVPFPPEKTFIAILFEKLRDLIRDILNIAGIAQPQTEVAQQSEMAFIRKAGSFDKLYLSYSHTGPGGNPRQIEAIRETRAQKRQDIAEPEYKTFISVEYFNYAAPICRFFYRHNYDEVRQQISSVERIECTPVITDANQWMHSIYVEEPVFEDIPSTLDDVRIWKSASDNFWNDITAKIRTQAPSAVSGTAPAVPEFTVSPSVNPVVGSPVVFTITNEPPVGEQWVARTWDFGDDMKASSQFNITTVHTYMDTKEGPGYAVKLCVMNQNYKITCAPEKDVEIGLGPSVEIIEHEQPDDQTVNITIHIDGGNPNFNVEMDWNNTVFSEEINGTSRDITFTYTYEASEFGTSNFIKKRIKVNGKDRDGVKFVNEKTIGIYKVLIP